MVAIFANETSDEDYQMMLMLKSEGSYYIRGLKDWRHLVDSALLGHKDIQKAAAEYNRRIEVARHNGRHYTRDLRNFLGNHEYWEFECEPRQEDSRNKI